MVRGDAAAVNPARRGTKAAARQRFEIPAGGNARMRLRLTDAEPAGGDPLGAEFDRTLALRRAEADEFYSAVIPPRLSADENNVMRQAFAGMLWSKQFYNYDVRRWLDGDPAAAAPARRRARPAATATGATSSTPTSSRCPTPGSTRGTPPGTSPSTASSCRSWTRSSPRSSSCCMLREWYMHPNGQIPAYEWNFGDVNPPVHAWAALRVYQIERANDGQGRPRCSSSASSTSCS